MLTAAAIVVGAPRRIGQLDARIAGNERQLVLLDELAEQALALEPGDLPVEQLEPGKAELGHVLEDRLVHASGAGSGGAACGACAPQPPCAAQADARSGIGPAAARPDAPASYARVADDDVAFPGRSLRPRRQRRERATLRAPSRLSARTCDD